MNRLDEYLKLPYTLVLIPDLEEGGFTAYFPELKGCVTCGETYTEAVENAMDAKRMDYSLHWRGIEHSRTRWTDFFLVLEFKT